MAETNVRETLSEKERLRLERIDKLDENKRRKKFIFAAVTAVLILFFAAGTVFGGMYILRYEGTQELPAREIAYPALPADEAAVYESYLALLADTKSFAGTKTDVSFDVSIPEDSILVNGQTAQQLIVYLLHIRSSVQDKLSACYDDQRHTGAYGEDFSPVVQPLHFGENDFASAEAVVNEENENDLRYVFTFDGCAYDAKEDAAASAVFSLAAAEKAVDSMKTLFEEVADIGDAQFAYDDFVLSAETDRLAQQLNAIRQTRICHVSLPLTFIGDYADFGTVTLQFDVQLDKVFRFTRVSFSFRDEVYYIEKGATDELKTSIVTDESPADVVVTWTSSDENVLAIDGNFYKGVSVSDKPVTVTGSYTYNGVTYTDSCQFFVRVPVEGISVDTKEMTLAKGQSDTLTASFSPANATIKTLYWFADDENVATVDENGNITAVGAGQTTVYCITLDGNYKSVCTVTVTA